MQTSNDRKQISFIMPGSVLGMYDTSKLYRDTDTF